MIINFWVNYSYNNLKFSGDKKWRYYLFCYIFHCDILEHTDTNVCS